MQYALRCRSQKNPICIKIDKKKSLPLLGMCAKLHCQCPKSNNIDALPTVSQTHMHTNRIILEIFIIEFAQFIPEISCSQNHTSRNLLAHFQLCSVEWPDIVAISVDIVVVRVILCSFLRLFYESFLLRQELLHTPTTIYSYRMNFA